jgi:hypothetical protein
VEVAVTLTQEQLEERLAFWQKVLRLQDWRVRVRLVRQRDLRDPGNQGESEWVLENRAAVIRVLEPFDYPSDSVWPQDMERTLVHELLHLHFAPFDAEPDTAESIAQEQAIDCIATGLVALHRGQRPGVDEASSAMVADLKAEIQRLWRVVEAAEQVHLHRSRLSRTASPLPNGLVQTSHGAMDRLGEALAALRKG